MSRYSRIHRHDVSYLSKAVRKDLTIKYEVLNLASDSITLRYDIFQLSGIKVKTVLYDLRQLATKTKNILYEINGDILKELEIIFTNWGGTGRGFPQPFDIPTTDSKFQVLNRYPFQIRATISASLTSPIEINGRLKDRYAGKINAYTIKFYKLNKLGKIDCRLVSPQDVLFDVLGQLVVDSRTRGIISKLNFKPILELVRRNLLILEGRVETFVFEDTNIPAVGDPVNFDREPTFQNPSSFVGLVTYFPDTQDMIVVLSDKPYNYCNVPQRTFDAFKGADSPGAFYNRNIKGILVCV